jgi:hypothetical protein
MDGCDTVDFVVVASRSIVLIIAAAGGILCIVLGWRLYKDAILSKTEGSATLKHGRIKLAAAGPGVFFALFGMWLLVKLVDRPIQIGNTAAPPSADVRGPTNFDPAGKTGQAAAAALGRANPQSSDLSPSRNLQKIALDESDDSKPKRNEICLVKRTHVIVMFGGKGENVTSAKARQALASASQALRREEDTFRSSGFLDAAAEKEAEIRTLDLMRSNVTD